METSTAERSATRFVNHRIFAALAAILLLILFGLWLAGFRPCCDTNPPPPCCAPTCPDALPQVTLESPTTTLADGDPLACTMKIIGKATDYKAVTRITASVDGGPPTDVKIDKLPTYSHDVTKLGVGAHSVEVRVQDSCGSVVVVTKTVECKARVQTNVLFDFDSSKFAKGDGNKIEDARVHLRSMVKQIVGSGNALIVEGYADRIGTDEYNEKLSIRRACRVREFLINASEGLLRSNQIACVEYFGETRPSAVCVGEKVDPHLIDCLKNDRRVSFSAAQALADAETVKRLDEVCAIELKHGT